MYVCEWLSSKWERNGVCEGESQFVFVWVSWGPLISVAGHSFDIVLEEIILEKN